MIHPTHPACYHVLPGLEQLLTEGMASHEKALWHTLRLKFWAGGCLPLTSLSVARSVGLLNLLDGAPERGTEWGEHCLTTERGVTQTPEGVVFPDLLEQANRAGATRARLAEAGRKGGATRKTSPG